MLLVLCVLISLNLGNLVIPTPVIRVGKFISQNILYSVPLHTRDKNSMSIVHTCIYSFEKKKIIIIETTANLIILNKIVTNIKNALTYGGASSTVGDPVLFECKAIITDCFSYKKIP